MEWQLLIYFDDASILFAWCLHRASSHLDWDYFLYLIFAGYGKVIHTCSVPS